MQVGLFLYPSHRPGTPFREGAERDLEMIRWADELGYGEVWIGEHFTVPWEPCPAPDLLIAMALDQTSRIRLGAGSHNLPYYHPSILAHRVAYLDHLSGGRINFGAGASGTPSDLHMFGIDAASGQNRKMMLEALDAIVRLWTEPAPYESSTEYWTLNKPELAFGGRTGFHLAPLQDPHPPISISGLSPKSDSLRLCGERGYMPLSLAFNDDYLAGHWTSISAGAESAGREPDRSLWRVVRDVFVAETDEEAMRLCLEGGIGSFLEDYWLPVIQSVGLLGMYKQDPAISDAEVTPAYVLKHSAMVGSVETVVRKIEEASEASGGFGTLLQLGHDFAKDSAPLRQSMELLVTEVMPRFGAVAS